MSKEIKLAKASLTGMQMLKRNGLYITRLSFHAEFDRSAAKAIGAEYTVFDKQSEIRTSYTGMDLDFKMAELKLRFAIPKMEDKALDLRSHSADNFKLKRKGDGKKKPSKLMVLFRVTHVGQMHELFDWWMQFGGQEGLLELAPQQAELPLADGKPAAERREVGKPSEAPAVKAARESFERALETPQGDAKRGPGRPKKVVVIQ